MVDYEKIRGFTERPFRTDDEPYTCIRDYKHISSQMVSYIEYLKREIKIQDQEYKNNFDSRKLRFEEKVREIKAKNEKKINQWKVKLEEQLREKEAKNEEFLTEKLVKMKEYADEANENSFLTGEVLRLNSQILDYELKLKHKDKTQLSLVKSEKILLKNSCEDAALRSEIVKKAKCTELNFKLHAQKDTIQMLQSSIEKIYKKSSKFQGKTESHKAFLKSLLLQQDSELKAAEESSFKSYSKKQFFIEKCKCLRIEISKLHHTSSILHKNHLILQKVYKKLKMQIYKPLPTN